MPRPISRIIKMARGCGLELALTCDGRLEYDDYTPGVPQWVMRGLKERADEVCEWLRRENESKKVESQVLKVFEGKIVERRIVEP